MKKKTKRHIEMELSLEQQEVVSRIMSIQQFYHLKNRQKLISIILKKSQSEKLFNIEKTMISNIFDTEDYQHNQLQKIKIFAQKYTFDQLADKYHRPKAGTNQVLIRILQKKMEKEVIGSHQTRKHIWMLASGARFAMQTHRGLYESLVNYQDYPNYFDRQICLDLNRTVPKNTISTQQQIKMLKNVLIAFSRRNSFIGYCQGLNFIAYFIITMQFTQQESFWLLSQITETIIPMDYYTNMIGVVCDQQIFLQMINIIKPKIAYKLRQLDFNASIITIQWFVCLFTSSLPFYLVKVLWDRLLVQGTIAFMKAGIIIFQKFQEQILATSQFHEIIEILEKGTKNLSYTESQFNQMLEKIYINPAGLKIARQIYRQYEIMQKLRQRSKQTRKIKQEKIQCNSSWPICIKALQRAKIQKKETEVWIYRQQNPPKLIHDYLSNQIKNLTTTASTVNGSSSIVVKERHKVILSSQFIIGRIAHQCIPTISSHKLVKRQSLPFSIIPQENQYSSNNTEILKNVENEQSQQSEQQDQQNGTKSFYAEFPNLQQHMNRLSFIYSSSVENNKYQVTKRSQTMQFYKHFVDSNSQLASIMLNKVKALK